MGGYIAQPLSRKDIRKMANGLRIMFGFENELSFPIVNVIEFLANNNVLNLEICTKEEMGSKLGETIPAKNLIKLREDIYDKACEDDGFSKATCAHELFHWLAHREETVSLCRREEDLSKRKAYEDPEWQSNCFSGELFVSKNLVKDMTIAEVMRKCKVTYSMAKYQLNIYKKERDIV